MLLLSGLERRRPALLLRVPNDCSSVPLMKDRDEFFMNMVELLAEQSTCVRGHCGALIVHRNRIVSMGYNGSPPGHKHCSDVGCLLLPGIQGCQRSVHAESNAVAFAARSGIRTEDGTMYATSSPCVQCALLVVSAGIVRFVFSKRYRVPEGLVILDESHVVLKEMSHGVRPVHPEADPPGSTESKHNSHSRGTKGGRYLNRGKGRGV